MDSQYKIFSELLSDTKDGDWGEEIAQSGYQAYRVIRSTDFSSARSGNLRNIPIRYLSENSAKRRTLQPNDILIETAGGSHDRPTGRTLLVTKKLLEKSDLPTTCASFCRFLRVDPILAEPTYVYWYLQFLYDKGEMWIHQVQHTGIARFQYIRFASTVQVPLPSLPEQRAIAHVLGSLDDKIELNRQTNDTLENITRALFKSWFVDFDPVHAKMAGRQPYGMDAETAALFPDTFEDSELGEIPRGWRKGKVDDLVHLSRKGLEPNEWPDEIFDHYSLPAFDDGCSPKAEAGNQIKSNKFLVSPNAILLSKINPTIPRVWFPSINSSHRRAICSTEFLVALPKANISPEYLFTLFCTSHFSERFITLATGTSNSHQRVRPDDLLNMQVVIPIPSLIKQFSDFSRPIYEKMHQNLAELSTLTAIRDTLLPKLLSGQLRIKEAEKLVESAV